MFPFDDYHRFYRPAAMVAVSMGGGNVKPILEWLQPEPVIGEFDSSDLRTFAALGITPPKG
jgi:hypothetical protein